MCSELVGIRGLAVASWLFYLANSARAVRDCSAIHRRFSARVAGRVGCRAFKSRVALCRVESVSESGPDSGKRGAILSLSALAARHGLLASPRRKQLIAGWPTNRLCLACSREMSNGLFAVPTGNDRASVLLLASGLQQSSKY